LELILYTENNILSLSWSNNLILSSILSLFIGSVLGLVQYRIKRLYAYSTISHVGFILLALSINTLESSRAFFFYIIQYSISNLNAFIILITIGYSLYNYTYKNNSFNNNSYSPIYLISQLKGYFYINPMISISLAITLFSFVGVPPLVGFFGKQMILTVAIDNGYLFSTFVAIITSVISAVYYLVLIKVIFFEKENYKYNNLMPKNLLAENNLNYTINSKDLFISSYLSLVISVITMLIVLILYFHQDFLRLIYIMSIRQ
jgi:NADH-ubiquinone oxidoreductase chain 2